MNNKDFIIYFLTIHIIFIIIIIFILFYMSFILSLFLWMNFSQCIAHVLYNNTNTLTISHSPFLYLSLFLWLSLCQSKRAQTTQKMATKQSGRRFVINKFGAKSDTCSACFVSFPVSQFVAFVACVNIEAFLWRHLRPYDDRCQVYTTTERESERKRERKTVEKAPSIDCLHYQRKLRIVARFRFQCESVITK